MPSHCFASARLLKQARERERELLLVKMKLLKAELIACSAIVLLALASCAAALPRGAADASKREDSPVAKSTSENPYAAKEVRDGERPVSTAPIPGQRHRELSLDGFLNFLKGYWEMMMAVLKLIGEILGNITVPPDTPSPSPSPTLAPSAGNGTAAPTMPTMAPTSSLMPSAGPTAPPVNSTVPPTYAQVVVRVNCGSYDFATNQTDGTVWAEDTFNTGGTNYTDNNVTELISKYRRVLLRQECGRNKCRIALNFQR